MPKKETIYYRRIDGMLEFGRRYAKWSKGYAKALIPIKIRKK